MRLTSAQREASEAPERYVCVEAGPGTGKSTVIAARCVYLVKQGEEPRSILVLTFTRAGAASIRRKVQEETGTEIRCLTFHEYAAGLLRDAGQLEGLSIATELETETAVRSLYEGGSRLPKGEACNISTLKKALIDFESGKHEVHGLAAQTVATLSLRLAELGRKPLFEVVPQAIESCPAPAEADEISHVLVDERQDLTPNEERLCIDCALPATLFAVGDSAQGIMQFRGAVPDAFASLKPTMHYLRESFRFGPSIAEAVNVVGRRIGVPDVVGMEESSSVAVRDFKVSGWPLPVENEMVLFPRNVDCEEHVRSSEASSVHVRRDPFGDPFGEREDLYDAAWEAGKVPVSTIHQSRGREADRVIVCGLGSVKDDRLAYVALSRARHELIIAEAQ